MSVTQELQPTKRDLLIAYADLSHTIRAAKTQDELRSVAAAMLDVLNALAKHGVSPDELRDAREGNIS
jgi:hypothetical protein